MPNHPQGVVPPEYRGRWVRRGRSDGFRVAHVWVRTRPEKSSRDRLMFYATFAGSAAAWGALTLRPDVVLASSPPLPGVAAAAGVARLRRVPWVLDVRDLWPDVAVALGELSEGRLLKLARAMERRLYSDAAAITTVTVPFAQQIARRTDQREKIRVVPNGTTSAWLKAGCSSRARHARAGARTLHMDVRGQPRAGSGSRQRHLRGRTAWATGSSFYCSETAPRSRGFRRRPPSSNPGASNSVPRFNLGLPQNFFGPRTHCSWRSRRTPRSSHSYHQSCSTSPRRARLLWSPPPGKRRGLLRTRGRL